jgi:peptidoglycan/LPS O-acetylase OafA/YrhL
MNKPNSDTKHLLHPKYRPDIDGLRAIAVLSVVIFHAFPDFLRGGFIGVDIFFVISGFLISTIIFENLAKNSFSFAEFYARRIKRIFPSLIIVLGVTYFFAWFVLLANEFEKFGKHLAGGAGFVANFIFLKEVGYFDVDSEAKPLLHLWSLGIEEQFYIIWPFLLWLIFKLRFNPFWLTILITAGSFILNILGIDHNPTRTFFSPFTRFWELLAGATLSYISCHKEIHFSKISNFFDRHKILVSNIFSFLGCGLFLIGFLLINKKSSFPGSWALVPVLGAVFIISAGQSAWINRNILSNKILVWFGLISFPLYLWHWPLLSFAYILNGQPVSLKVRLVAVFISILLAWLSFRFVEKPIRTGAKNKSIIWILISLMFFLGALGFITSKKDGFEFRQEESVRENAKLLSYKFPSSDACKKLRPFVPSCYESEKKYPRTILVMGDSHMEIVTHGFIELFNSGELKYNVLALGGTGFSLFMNTERVFANGAEKGCKKVINRIIDEATHRPDISHLILIGRHAERYSGTGFGSVEKNRESGTCIYKSGNTISSSNQSAFELGLKQTVKEVTSAGKKVIFLHQAPELGFYPRSCLRKPPKFLQAKCQIDESLVIARQQPYRSVISKIAQEYPEMIEVDPLPLVCKNSVCSPLDSAGRLIYRDDDHLSKLGAVLFAKRINNFL